MASCSHDSMSNMSTGQDTWESGTEHCLTPPNLEREQTAIGGERNLSARLNMLADAAALAQREPIPRTTYQAPQEQSPRTPAVPATEAEFNVVLQKITILLLRIGNRIPNDEPQSPSTIINDNNRHAINNFSSPPSRSSDSTVDDDTVDDDDTRGQEGGQLADLLSPPLFDFDRNGRVHRLKRPKGDAIHWLIASSAQRRMNFDRLGRHHDNALSMTRANEELGRMIDERREGVRSVDVDATEDEAEEGEKAGEKKEKAVAGLGVTQSKGGKKGKGKARQEGKGKGKGKEKDVPVAPAIDNGEGPSQPQNACQPIEAATLALPFPLLERRRSAIQAGLEKGYKIASSNETLEGNLYSLKEILSKPKFSEHERSVAENRAKMMKQMKEVVDSSSKLGPKGLFHGNGGPSTMTKNIDEWESELDARAIPKRKSDEAAMKKEATRIRKRTAYSWQMMPEPTKQSAASMEPGRDTCTAATATEAVDSAAPLSLSRESEAALIPPQRETSVLPAPPAQPAASKIQSRKRSANEVAAHESVGVPTSQTPSPSKKRKVSLKLKVSPEADEKHKDHAQHLARFNKTNSEEKSE